MVGTAFSHLKGATTLSKCTATQFPLTFYQTGCDIILVGYSLSLCCFGNDFFSFQRKEAKERRLLKHIPLLSLNRCNTVAKRTATYTPLNLHLHQNRLRDIATNCTSSHFCIWNIFNQ
jgi:hypothetical protein